MHSLIVLKPWFTVLFKTLSVASLTSKSLALLLRGRHFLPRLFELLLIAWLLPVRFALHAAFRFISEAGDAQGEAVALHPFLLFSRRFEL